MTAVSRKILITGGSGFVGSAIVEKLLNQGHKITNIDLIDAQINHENYKYVPEDILNKESISKYFNGVDVVIHAAAKLPLHKKKSSYELVNIQGTKNIVDLSNESSVEYFMYLSSSAIMGKQNLEISENSEPNPFEPYGISKYKGELIIKDTLNKSIKYSMIRPRTVVGDERLGIFGLLFSFFKNSIPVFLLGNGKNCLQLIDKDELVEVIVRLIEHNIQGVFNLGNNDSATIYETFFEFKKIIKSESKIVKLPKKITMLILTILDKLNLSPFAPYHYKAFGESVMFTSSKAYEITNYFPKKNNVEILHNAYKNYEFIQNDDESVSTHKKDINLKIFRILKIFKKRK
tara:strand:- start:4991 stop:6031 length:1041 start_codon:yes stop_codon:yes gene_type:complete